LPSQSFIPQESAPTLAQATTVTINNLIATPIPREDIRYSDPANIHIKVNRRVATVKP
jgi:hypothetical protein